MTQAINFKKCNHGAMLDRQFLHRIVQFFLKFPHVSVTLTARRIRQCRNDFPRNGRVRINLLQTKKRPEPRLPEMT